MTKKYLAIIPLLASLNAFGTTPSVFLWDNQEGLVPAKSCEIIPSATTHFKVSNYTGWKKSQTENLRNYYGVKQSHLANGSLVKLIKGARKSSYKKVEVVGVNKDPQIVPNRWFSERLDRGYLFKNSLFPIEDYILEVDHKNIVETEMKKITKKDSSFWFAEAAGSYYNLECQGQNENRKYTLFRVYEDIEKSTEPSAFVGVYWDETKIFKNIKTIKVNSLEVNFETFEKVYDLAEILSDSDNEVIENENLLTVNEEIIQEMKLLKEATEKASENKSTQTTAIEVTSPTEKEEYPSQVNTVAGSFKDVVCVPKNSLNVRNEELNKVLFKAKKGELVKKFQGFTDTTKDLDIDGVTYKFIKVQFSAREETDQNIGWVARKFIKQEASCKYIKGNAKLNLPKDTQITGIDDVKCCEFPTVKAPTQPYTSGMRMFNARRGQGTRSHAACDLYRYKNEPILSVAPGVVVRDKYYFYQGTYAIEVVHSGGFVARYGELSGKKQSGIKKSAQLKMGQRIGYMGKVNSNCCRPMLHFEIFSGKKKGALSQSGNKYKRRTDLLDPTHYLQKWEAGKF